MAKHRAATGTPGKPETVNPQHREAVTGTPVYDPANIHTYTSIFAPVSATQHASRFTPADSVGDVWDNNGRTY